MQMCECLHASWVYFFDLFKGYCQEIPCFPLYAHSTLHDNLTTKFKIFLPLFPGSDWDEKQLALTSRLQQIRLDILLPKEGGGTSYLKFAPYRPNLAALSTNCVENKQRSTLEEGKTQNLSRNVDFNST